jgi:hypothetical protein
MSRLDSLCQNLPDDTIESLVASMLKAAASQAPMREEADGELLRRRPSLRIRWRICAASSARLSRGRWRTTP